MLLGNAASQKQEKNISDGNELQRTGEQWLVAAAKNGQRPAFAALYERYGQQLLRATYRITKTREDAEDALQDSLLSAFIHIKDFDGRSSFSTWLTRIAINCALMKLRKNRGYREISTDEPLDSEAKWPRYEPVDGAPDPEESHVLRERERMVTTAVRALRPAIRRAVEIRHLQECSIKETAQALGISVEATKGRLFHARAALRKASRLRMVRQVRVRRAA
jgi:RNA polymerase sigma factor (sigma-70 family)